MEEMRKQSAQEESDDDYRPQDDVEEEDNEVEFTADDFEAEEEHDEDREAYLAREIHGLRHRSGEGVSDEDAAVIQESASSTAETISGGGRPRRGAAVRAKEAIARESARKRATAQSSGGVSCAAAVAFVLLLLIPAFIYSIYNPAYASFAAGGNCGMDSNRFAQELDAQKYTEALQYSKANYATEPALSNVDQISNVLFGKRASQPVVMLFVSSDSEDRKQVMNDFVDGLARIYFNTSDVNPAAFRFNAGQDHTDMKKRITSQLRECGRGLFAADASVMLDHFDFMETALEDGVSFIELENGERFYTDESTFIVMDTLKEDLLRRFTHDPAANQAKAKAAVASQVQIKQSPRWTKRFGQRVQDVFVF